jgi:predicted secreted protein
MNWFTAALLFVVIWWLVFFMALPWGIRTAKEVGEEVGAGHADSAPVNPRLWLKAGVTTLITAAILGLVLASVEFEWIDYRALFVPRRD